VRTSLYDIWGSGRGPAVQLAPQCRIMTGAILFAACLTAPSDSLFGIALITAVTAAWAAACRMPGRLALSFTFLGLAMFLPYVLIALILPVGPGTFSTPLNILVHGMAGLYVTTSTIATLTAGDLRDGLLALPIPRVISAICIQIVHQTSGLLSETKRIASALAVRGASGTGRAVLRILASLPRVWLPRIIDRADRLAAAMEFRGYAEADLGVFRTRPGAAADAAVIALAAGIWALAAALRWRFPT